MSNRKYYCTCEIKHNKIVEGDKRYRQVNVYADGICEDCHHYAVLLTPEDLEKKLNMRRKYNASQTKTRKNNNRTF